MKKHITSVLALALSLGTASAVANNSGFDNIDRDKKGHITKSEFQQNVVERHFMQLDRNRDGMLDETELSNSRLDINMSQFDTDRDGRISRTEFADGLFNKFDKNRDGRLSKEEWKEVENAGIGR